MSLVRPRHTLEVLSVSALDIFASSLGVFVLMAIVLFPYYLREPAREDAMLGAEARLTSAADAQRDAALTMAQAEAELVASEALMAAAEERLERAQQAASAAAAARAQAETKAKTAVPLPEPRKPGPEKATITIDDMDLVFVMDVTGSMKDELKDLQANVVGLVRILGRLSESLRIGFVAFKDRGDDFLTRTFPLTYAQGPDIGRLVGFLWELEAQGGGDPPEPVDEALAVAMAMPWRTDAQGQIIVIGDAPVLPPNASRAIGLTKEFRASAPWGATERRVSAIYTGERGATRQFFENLARVGGGDFSVHQGKMLENVLLAVLPTKQASR